MLELKVLDKQMPVIATNYEEVKAYVLKKRDEYRNIIVTDDNLAQAKKDKKELASARVTIENFRKEKKKEMSTPIVEMEKQCKELISYIEEVEWPLAADIDTFDEKKRQKRREQALSFIEKEAEAIGLRKEYASRLQVKDFYLNLTGTQKEVKEDIKKEAAALKALQDKDDADKAIIIQMVEKANESILVKLNEKEFLDMLSHSIVADVIERIQARTTQIQESEKLAKEKAERERMEKENIFPNNKVTEGVLITNVSASTDVSSTLQGCSSFAGNNIPQIPMPAIPDIQQPSEEMWALTLNIKATRSQLKELNAYIKEKGIEYLIVNQVML